MTDVIKVEVDPNVHSREPENEHERIAWAALDTAWNLLRDTAVKLTLNSLRELAAEQGIQDFPASDEALFEEARQSGDPDAPTSYRDLAPENPIAAAGLDAVLKVLTQDAYSDAQQSIIDVQDIESL